MKSGPIKCEVIVEGHPLQMEVDTGVDISIISNGTRMSLFPTVPLNKTKIQLKTYTDKTIKVAGEMSVKVKYGNQMRNLKLIVVAGEGPSLFGRNWLQAIHLDWHHIGKVVTPSPNLAALLEQHKAIFREELGTIAKEKATLSIKPDTTPKFHKPVQCLLP